MTEPGNQGERNGMRNIRTDDAHYGKMRIYQDQHRYADRAGADRGQRHKSAKYRAEQYGNYCLKPWISVN